MSTHPSPFPTRRFLAPRYWLTWLALASLWGLAHLPGPALYHVGRLLGVTMRIFSRHRRHVAQANLRLCFTQMDEAAHRQLLAQHFTALGHGVVETALCWFAPAKRLAALAHIEGLEHLHATLQHGHGAIILIGHFTSMEMAGTLLAMHTPLRVTYRRHSNPLFEAVMARARRSHCAHVIEHHDVRAMLQALKHGESLWYAPDQNYNGKRSAFVPFFGIAAATMTSTAAMARLSGAAVLPLVSQRLAAAGGYRLTLLPPLTNFPSGDDVADTHRLNTLIENQVRQIPDQYLWVHRRFKSRPPGEPTLYPTRRRRSHT